MTWFMILSCVLGLILGGLYVFRLINTIRKKRKGVKVNAVIEKGVPFNKVSEWYVHYEYNGKQYYSYFLDPPLAHHEGDTVEIAFLPEKPEEIFIHNYLTDVTTVIMLSIGWIVLLVSLLKRII